MRRSTALFAIGLTVLAGTAAWRSVAARPVQQSVGVSVTVYCDGEEIANVVVNPDPVTLSKSAGDTADFVLTEDSQVAEIRLAPKTGEGLPPWPFVANPPTVPRGQGRNSGAIRGNAAVGSYGYDIMARCGSGMDRWDPRMDIDP